jgi:hypothetical protein
MTFRISKYAHNSWKTAAFDKNIKYNYYKVDYFNIYGFLLFTGGIINFLLGVSFYKDIVNENKIIQESVKIKIYFSLKFENLNKWLLIT